MTLNRRHKAILFVTLVISGCALLLGAELKETFGFMMLGGTFAWAIGSRTASKVYAGLKGASGTFYSWIRPLLAMTLAGAILGAVLLYSRGNAVLVVASMSVAGIFLAPLLPLPTQRMWLRVPLIFAAIAAYLVAMWLVISTDLTSSEKYAERYGQLAVTGLLTFMVGFFWLSKGWDLIGRGISTAPSEGVLPSIASTRSTWGKYISVLLGVLVLTLWLALLSWSASSDWKYAPEKISNEKGKNLFTQFAFVVLLASWPYLSWRNILNRESNSNPKYLRRHRRTSAIAGMIFVVVVSLSITYGLQNGNDRLSAEKIESASKDVISAGSKIGTVKQRNLETTEDYIQAYAEIDELLPDFESKLKKCTEVYEESREIDESRGPINAQVFYKSHKQDMWKDNFTMLDLLRQVDLLTQQEVLTIRNMSKLPHPDQIKFWQTQFRPLLIQQDDLREKIQAVAAKIQHPPK